MLAGNARSACFGRHLWFALDYKHANWRLGWRCGGSRLERLDHFWHSGRCGPHSSWAFQNVRQFSFSAVLDKLTNLSYLIPRAFGTLSFVGSFAISLLLGRVEALVPIIFVGMALVTFSETWKRLRVELNPVAVKAEAGLSISFKILWSSIIVNFLTASLGLALQTGFSFTYALSLLVGVILTLVGIYWGAGSMLSAKR